jgi:dTDP-4-amino-4,6-dideoxygalactose transaminase
MIPFSNPSASYQSHKSEIVSAIVHVLDSGWYVLGKEVEAFEKEFADFHGKSLHSVGVANGTDAIALCLKSLGLGQGDEIVTTSHTAVATIAGIEQAGCSTVFADINPRTRCIDPRSIEQRIGPKTRAIMPVHIYGQPCDMNAIQVIAQSKELRVIEDCSQAHGAEINGNKVGTFGTLAAYSCYPTKNLGGTGDGGVILCKSQEMAEQIKSLRQYGWNNQRESIISGFNSRLDEMQAAILRVKLKHLSEDNRKRRAIADQYDDAFKDLPVILPHRSKDELHAMHLYVIECDNRDTLLKHLRNRGIGASLHYALPVHKHTAYSERIRGGDELPHTEAFYKKNLTLPIFPELTQESIDTITSGVQDWFKQK